MRTARAIPTLLLCALAPLAPLAAAGVRLPEYEAFELDNGLRLILVEKSDVPLISFHARLEGGDLADPPGREGSAEVLAELLIKGAGERDALEFSQAVDSVGGELSVATGREAMLVSGQFMSRDRSLMLELLSDLLLRPRLDQAEFEKIRQRLIQAIAAAKDNNPNGVIGSYFEAFLFAGHPYGRLGDETSLAALEHADLPGYFRSHVGADRAVIAFVGDFDAAALRAELEAIFGGWRAASAPPVRVEATPEATGGRVLLVDKPDATQTFFWIGSVGVARDDPNRVALDVANTAFGGRFTSMLNTELRVETGLTYGARSLLVRRRQPGIVAITSYTRTEATEEAVDRSLEILGRLHREGLDDETLASVKAYLIGLFPLRLETGDQLAARLTEIAFYGLDRSDVDDYTERVGATSRGELEGVISRVYPPTDDLVFVFISDAEAVRGIVAKYGELTEMSITDERFVPSTRSPAGRR